MRITPACAGSKINYSWIKYRSQDHPRVCGEQPLPVAGLGPQKGSPPRVRGTASETSGITKLTRITPACAGNRLLNQELLKLLQDYPRVCGEQGKKAASNHLLIGSPPRVRGTEKSLDGSTDNGGITPACAGNSCGFHSNFANAQDHPRVCGEQIAFHTSAAGISGSPPRVRGTALCSFYRLLHGGITPACAGNRCIVWRCRRLLWDHPRVCGEQFVFVIASITNRGSPPRVRGTVINAGIRDGDVGITPACAGNSHARII